ncbi:uncharacterized protein V2V93DRAFT_366431 [Kockiozyma suomiensis]|uniref:uncharacterized protein n=1 Tax=Kockiozyma suomiensis TaxID=1337062 RepID=UPI003343AC99
MTIKGFLLSFVGHAKIKFINKTERPLDERILPLVPHCTNSIQWRSSLVSLSRCGGGVPSFRQPYYRFDLLLTLSRSTISCIEPTSRFFFAGSIRNRKITLSLGSCKDSLCPAYIQNLKAFYALLPMSRNFYCCCKRIRTPSKGRIAKMDGLLDSSQLHHEKVWRVFFSVLFRLASRLCSFNLIFRHSCNSPCSVLIGNYRLSCSHFISFHSIPFRFILFLHPSLALTGKAFYLKGSILINTCSYLLYSNYLPFVIDCGASLILIRPNS